MFRNACHLGGWLQSRWWVTSRSRLKVTCKCLISDVNYWELFQHFIQQTRFELLFWKILKQFPWCHHLSAPCSALFLLFVHCIVLVLCSLYCYCFLFHVLLLFLFFVPCIVLVRFSGIVLVLCSLYCYCSLFTVLFLLLVHCIVIALVLRWSYGVLLWEVFSYAEQPYADISSNNLLYQLLPPTNHRLSQPVFASDDV